MSALVDAVRAHVPQSCRAARCRKQGVSASLSGLPDQRVLVDLDCHDLDIDPKMRRCDFVLACDDNQIAQIAPIELKHGDVEPADVAAQLAGGAQIAERWLPQEGSSRVRFRPVVVYGGKFNRPQRRKPTAKEKVRFRGRHYEVKPIRKGSPLLKALGAAGASSG